MNIKPTSNIQDAIHNPLLLQQNNPLISQSMSLLNSRLKKSFDQQIQKQSGRQLSGRGRKEQSKQQHGDIVKITKYDDISQDWQSEGKFKYAMDQRQHQDQRQNQMQNMRAVQQFQRQIQQKYKLSVSNKLYTFPRMKITSIMDIISSSSQQQNEEDTELPFYNNNLSNLQETSRSSSQSPFNPDGYHNRFKFQPFVYQEQKQINDHKSQKNRNFKKVKSHSKDIQQLKPIKQTKIKNLAKDLPQNNTHTQKPKQPKDNPQNKEKDRLKLKYTTNRHIDQKLPQRLSNTRDRPLLLKKTKPHRQNAQRLRTQIYNDQSQISQQITQSKKKFYKEEFFIIK